MMKLVEALRGLRLAHLKSEYTAGFTYLDPRGERTETNEAGE